MHTYRFFPGLLCLATLAALTSCTAPMRTPFNEADFAWSDKPGTGVVEGRAYIVMRDHSVNVGRKTFVVLFPKNAYTTEIIRQKYEHGHNLALADDRMAKYLHGAWADSQGHFRMTHVAPGDYYVGAMVDWLNSYNAADSWNQIQTYTDNHSQFIHAEITVNNGSTNYVNDWLQGADWNMDTALH